MYTSSMSVNLMNGGHWQEGGPLLRVQDVVKLQGDHCTVNSTVRPLH